MRVFRLRGWSAYFTCERVQRRRPREAIRQRRGGVVYGRAELRKCVYVWEK